MSIKFICVRPLQRLALASGLSAALGRRQAAARIIMLHGVGGPALTAEALTAQLLHLHRHYRIVPLAELVAALQAGEGAAGAVALTFDDGLRNNLTIAYPILRRLNLPATFFVCPGLIDEGAWLWNHACRARLRTLAPAARQDLLHGLGAPEGALAGDPVEWMKTLAQECRREVEAALRAATPDFTPTPQQRQDHDLMNWDELAALDPALITIGAHTVTHPILTALSPAEQAGEIGADRARLEARLGRPVRFFCYPNGSHDAAAVRLVRQHFDAAVTTEIGPVRPGDDLWRLPRIPVADGAALMAWRMHRPQA